MLRENRRLSDELKAVDVEPAAAKEQWRREALQCVPELAIEAVADFVVVNISQHTNADFRKRAIEGVRWLRALIESARDAQEKT